MAILGPVRNVLRIALLALVLAAQTVAHVHAADHGTPVGKSKCPVCVVAQPSGEAAVDCGSDGAGTSASTTHFAAPAPTPGESATAAPHARAPPRTR